MDKLQTTQNAVQVKLSRERFMNDFSVSRCNELFEKVSRVEHIFENLTPTIGRIKKDYGSNFIRLYLITWMISLNLFLNVKSKMNKVQTDDTARLIAKEFYNLTITDIHFVFENAKRGYYGKFYDRLDGTMILEWFRNHLAERCTAYDNKLMQKDLQYKDSRMNYEESLYQSIRRRNSEDKRAKSIRKSKIKQQIINQ